MSPALEDRMGKMILLSVFSLLFAFKVINVSAWLQNGILTTGWPLRLAQEGLGVGFLGLVVAMTMRRLPATHGPAGIEPRISAIAGTFALYGLVALPAVEAPLLARLAGVTLMAAGLAGSVYALWHLGRAFSIAPTARELVTTGPYGVVRHPLYVTEAISALGLIIAHWSWAAALLGLAQLALQYRRIGHEERVLQSAFPASYGAYKARVPMLIPHLSGVRSVD